MAAGSQVIFSSVHGQTTVCKDDTKQASSRHSENDVDASTCGKAMPFVHASTPPIGQICSTIPETLPCLHFRGDSGNLA